MDQYVIVKKNHGSVTVYGPFSLEKCHEELDKLVACLNEGRGDIDSPDNYQGHFVKCNEYALGDKFGHPTGLPKVEFPADWEDRLSDEVWAHTYRLIDSTP